MDRPMPAPDAPAAADPTAPGRPVRPAVTVRCIECESVTVRPGHHAWVLAAGWAGPEVPGVCPACQEARFAVPAAG